MGRIELAAPVALGAITAALEELAQVELVRSELLDVFAPVCPGLFEGISARTVRYVAGFHDGLIVQVFASSTGYAIRIADSLAAAD